MRVIMLLVGVIANGCNALYLAHRYLLCSPMAHTYECVQETILFDVIGRVGFLLVRVVATTGHRP
jgi:hypothetical protein